MYHDTQPAEAALIDGGETVSNGLIQDGKLNWAGEHWVNYIRKDAEPDDSGMVSLYHTRYSPAGGGNVAFVDVPGDDGYKALCTDNRELADYVVDVITAGSTHRPYGQELPIVDAEFKQHGDVRADPGWTIQAGDHVVTATWTDILPVIIANGEWPGGGDVITAVFSLLHFAEGSTITLDGRSIEGGPYLRDIWRVSIGGDRSSCVFALSETFIGQGA